MSIKKESEKLKKAAEALFGGDELPTSPARGKAKANKQANIERMIQELEEFARKLDQKKNEVASELKPGRLIRYKGSGSVQCDTYTGYKLLYEIPPNTTDGPLVLRLHKIRPEGDRGLVDDIRAQGAPISLSPIWTATQTRQGLKKLQIKITKGDHLLFLGYLWDDHRAVSEPVWLIGEKRTVGWLYLEEIEVLETDGKDSKDSKQ
jgi:hypothetical protein